MTKKVLLKFGKGSFDTGFSAIAQFAGENSCIIAEVRGDLPPSPDLLEIYERWRIAYENLGYSFRSLNWNLNSSSSIMGRHKFFDLSKTLEKSLNFWLNSQEFRFIKDTFISKLKRSEENVVIIQTEDDLLRRIPWHLWDIFDYYPKTEVALGALTYDKVERFSNCISSDKVRILAVLGNSDGINLQKDRELLECLPDAEINFLVEPSRRKLDSFLWDEQGYDILFFAGHSYSQIDGQAGNFYINQTDTLTISELKNALKASIERRLQIAVFNSCDGLGLAQSLADLHIPQVICMREPVPDLVAHEFLNQFLKLFSRGKSLYFSVREARAKLQGLENDFPCASWLPVLFQNPAEPPPTWQELCPLSFVTQQKAKKEYLRLSQQGIEAWNKWREKHHELLPDLRNVDLAGANLAGANLSGVNLSRANLAEANLTDADLRGANLTDTNLTRSQALNTNFTQALLTGVCIQDWHINNATNLEGVICSYIYLQESKKERRPSSGEFAPGDFTKIFQKALSTVDLIFRNGVNWEAFAYSFKKIQVENESSELSIQSIEAKGEGVFVIKVNTSSSANKEKIHSEFIQGYEFALKALEDRYRAELSSKSEEIQRQTEHINKLFLLLNQLQTVQKNIAEAPKYDLRGSKFGGGFTEKFEVNQNVTTHYNFVEIQQLLNDLAETNATSETAFEAIYQEININNPTLKARLQAALRAGGLEALKAIFNHPVLSIPVEKLKSWLETE
ncbi:pentapeptide repeat-containing protein [Nostoc sp. UHCC 0870]|uniref:pentapeptide repeat-containing protein n=1 Tax=Nostoc sp. UHCC 0870 TaxID=2914041 RepID=UPI001EE0F92F|nr:pentapeptide repeat-containing protein [Nostoc sp. UHCC 0870]UKP01381.1 pentapeptide repeat-containing protein [Nostoc sp. UHCC 0870]